MDSSDFPNSHADGLGNGDVHSNHPTSSNNHAGTKYAASHNNSTAESIGHSHPYAHSHAHCHDATASSRLAGR